MCFISPARFVSKIKGVGVHVRRTSRKARKARKARVFICADQSYTLRHTVLTTHLSGVTDLVRLIESYIPMDCPHFPLWYIFEKRTEFYQAQPQKLFGHVGWNYYAMQHKGVALYILLKGTYCEAVLG